LRLQSRCDAKPDLAGIYHACYIPRDLLHLILQRRSAGGFIKKTQQTPARELKLARKRLKEVQHG
jgi:hypothetical protein